MNDFDSDIPGESEWEERGGLVWNEFDWERYLREQEESIHRYLGHYEALSGKPDRIDLVAQRMGWETPEEAPDDDSPEREPKADEPPPTTEIYTLHKNPVFIATKALALSVKRTWELLAVDPAKVPPPVALPFLASLNRAEDVASQAVHALDFGDYAMAVSLFKRALSELNGALAMLDPKAAARLPAVAEFCEFALPRLFDLREIWLRVISECRGELEHPLDEEI